MMKETSFPLSANDLNVDPPTGTIHERMNRENDPLIPVSQHQDDKPSSPYLTLSTATNQRSNLADFQDPLFYQEPLHFHYSQSIPSKSGLGYETGDRVRLTNDIKSNEYRKRASVSSRKHEIGKSKSTHRRYTNAKKTPLDTHDQSVIKSTTENMTPSPLFSLTHSLSNKLSSTSTVLPLTKNSAQLTSKNNNKRASQIKRRQNCLTSIRSRRKLIGTMRPGMTLRSGTIIINHENSSKRSGKKYK